MSIKVITVAYYFMIFIKSNVGYISMFIAVIGFGSGPPFVKLALQEFYVMDLMAVRFSLAFVLMLIFALLMRVDLSIKKIGLTPFLMGLLNPFLVTLSFHIGLLLTSPVSGVALISTLPIWQPFVARVFLKEKIEIKVIIGAFITIIGTLILLSTQKKIGGGNYLGDFIIFLGMMCVSINEVLGRRFMQTKVNQLGVNTFQYMIGAILSILILFIVWPDSSFTYNNYLNFSPPVLAAITLSFITFGAYLFYNFALRRAPIGRISLMYPLTGPIGATMSWIVLGSTISINIFISLIIILVGTIIPQINKKAKD
jgi:drug/metabolite transporter (DMT)-like permease|tara:strand:+ start:77 stop:1012 length:936 start_codon:yes stop_codon:yes gene_type:complete